jgi:hypothetical protein
MNREEKACVWAIAMSCFSLGWSICELIHIYKR